MDLSPIVLFCYNRPKQTAKALGALADNLLANNSTLYIYCDGAKNNSSIEDLSRIESVRNIARNATGFKNVIVNEQSENKGLANSIIDGVTEVVKKHGKIIVLEDDLVTSPYFLTYMNEALNLYENDDEVISIHGYIYPLKNKMDKAFFIKGADCWGWGTWKRGWDLFEKDGQKLLNQIEDGELSTEFDFNNSYPYKKMLKDQVEQKNNSWAIRWYASAFLANKLTLYPGVSYVQNIGMDASGTHSGITTKFDVNLNNGFSIYDITVNIEESREGKNLIIAYFNSSKSNKLITFFRDLKMWSLLKWNKIKS